VHVFLLDEDGRIYLQKRSIEKLEHPGKWDSSASGHVESGESYQTAAARELEEEIGVKATPEPVFRVRGSEETGMEHSMVFQVRRSATDPDPSPHPGEILEGRFFEPREIEQRIDGEPEIFSPSFLLLYRLYREKTVRAGD
jgi:isopentenyldiphosphate isomerase